MHGLVRCTNWLQVFTRARGGCDNHRCHNKKKTDRKWPGTWMTSCPEAILEFEKSSLLRFNARGRESIFGARRGQTSSLRRGAARGGVKWKSQHRKKLCLFLFMSKNLKLKKVIKSFVPEPKKRVVSVWRISGFPVYISHIHILVVFLNILQYFRLYVFFRRLIITTIDFYMGDGFDRCVCACVCVCVCLSVRDPF